MGVVSNYQIGQVIIKAVQNYRKCYALPRRKMFLLNCPDEDLDSSSLSEVT